jgi:tripartite-type tricarboxylate transporter receptor subunit TctC
MQTRFTRRHALGALASAASAVALPTWAQAPAYPARPVKLVVGSSPGGPSDFLARVMADAMSPAFKQSFVVDNKPGASGMPAAENVVKSAADGHTLLITGPASIAVMPHLFSKITYAPLVDLTPVAMLGAGAFVLVVHPSVNARNVQELIALAKARPDGLAYGSGGNGSSGHLCTELFSQQVGAKMVHVPYKGDGQAMNDLLAGQVQVMFTAPNVAMPHIKSGRLKLLAVTTRDRVPSLPDTPTVHESGLKDFEYLGWIIVFAPAGTPAPVIESLATAWHGAKATPAVRGKLDDLAMSAPERLGNRPALLEFVKSEHARLGKLIREAGVKTE